MVPQKTQKEVLQYTCGKERKKLLVSLFVFEIQELLVLKYIQMKKMS